MKYRKRLLAAIPVMALTLSLGAPFAMADEAIAPNGIEAELNPFNESAPLYSSFEGTISEIRVNGETTYVRVAKDADHMIDFVINESSLFADIDGIITLEDLKEGDAVKAFYIMPQITTMIYPAQYQVDAIVKTDVKTEVYADKFNDSLVAGNNFLKLNVSEETEVLDAQGNKLSHEYLENKNLLVFYKFTTFSIPPQTAPSRIIVLDSTEASVPDGVQIEAVHPIYQLSEEEIAMLNEAMAESVKDAPILVNNQEIEAPSPYVNENGTVMLPVRPIAEALNLDVAWDSETSTVTLAFRMGLTIGKDSYVTGRMAPISLGDVPEIKDGVTYAPITFFTSIVNAGVMITDNTVNITMVYN